MNKQVGIGGQWLARSTHRKKVLGLNPLTFLYGVYISSVCVGYLRVLSDFLPQTKNLDAVWLWECVVVCLSVLAPCSILRQPLPRYDIKLEGQKKENRWNRWNNLYFVPDENKKKESNTKTMMKYIATFANE